MALQWTREESILALALYFQAHSDVTGKVPDSESAMARELSDTLRRLSAYPAAEQPGNYRTKNSVRLKLANFLSAQREGAGMSNHSRMDAAILWEFFDNRADLFRQASAIRAGIGSRGPRSGHPDAMKAETVPLAAEVEIEQHNTNSFEVKPTDVLKIAQRAEAQLVHDYRDHMNTQGFQVSRMKYEPAGEAAMYSDAWVSAKNLLIEAKSAQGRDALRQAIGQLYDYRRFHTPVRPVLAVLLSYEPTGDRRAFLQDAGIGAIWPRPRRGFQDTADGAYV
jgi:hypothetical protein